MRKYVKEMRDKLIEEADYFEELMEKMESADTLWLSSATRDCVEAEQLTRLKYVAWLDYNYGSAK